MSKLFRQKLTSLPPSCLISALEKCSHFIETQQDIIQALEVLLSTNKQEYILKAFDIGFQCKVNPRWLAQQLKNYWSFWFNRQEDLERWWDQNRLYFQKVLLALPLTKDWASKLMDCLLTSPIYPRDSHRSDLKLMENPGTYSEQIVVLLQCLDVIKNRDYPHFLSRISIELGGIKPLRTRLPDTEQNPKGDAGTFTNSGLLAILDQLMERTDLMPQLRTCLWALYWQMHEPTEPIVTTFLAESKAWSKNQSLSKFWLRNSIYSWPLLALALESQMNDNQHTIDLLRPHLNASGEVSICQQVEAALQRGLDRLSYEEQFAAVLCNYFAAQQFPEIASIAEMLGMNSDQLVRRYISLTVYGNFDLSSATIKIIFSNLEKSITQSQQLEISWWLLEHMKWRLDHETTRQGKQ